MNPDPEIWGNNFWFTLHSVSFFYPEYPTSTDMHKYKTFFETISYVLPCPSCKEHYRKILNDYPIDPYLESRDSLIRWVILVHNKVNLRIGKKEISYQDAINEYSKKYIRPEKKDKNIKTCIIVCLIIFISFVFAWATKMHNITSKNK